MASAGKLVYKVGGTSGEAGSLVYKGSGTSGEADRLCYKINAGGETMISFAWSLDGQDLDICAFWEDAPDMKAGWGWSADSSQETTTTTTVNGVAYTITYSGDVTLSDSSEWVKIIKSPWSKDSRSFRVYLNFYGYDASQHPATTCTVIAAQMNGPTKMLTANCGSRTGERANPLQPNPDPFVTITFGNDGKLLSITQ